MMVDGLDGHRCRGNRKEGEDPESKHQIQPECGERENDQTDAWRDSQNFSAIPKSQGRTGTYKFIFPVQLTPSKIGD